MLSNKLYDWLKWLAIAGLHALGVAYNALANIWGLPYGQAIPETLDIVGVLLAAFLAWQSYDYSKTHAIISLPAAAIAEMAEDVVEKNGDSYLVNLNNDSEEAN